MPPLERPSDNDEALRAVLASAVPSTILTRLNEVCERSRLSVREILAQAIDFAWHVQMSGELDCRPEAPCDGRDASPEPAPSRYNGWTNYETWAVHLWLTNEEGTYRHCRRLARECIEQAAICDQLRHGIWTLDESRRFLLADAVQEFVEGMNPLNEDASMFTDLVNAALSEVNWHEIAEAFLED